MAYFVRHKVSLWSNMWTTCTVLCFHTSEGYYYNIHKSRGYENEITTQCKEHAPFEFSFLLFLEPQTKTNKIHVEQYV